MAGQATGCNGHEHRRWCRQWCRHRRPSLVPHPTGSWRRVQGRAISPQYKDRMTAGTAGWGGGGRAGGREWVGWCHSMRSRQPYYPTERHRKERGRTPERQDDTAREARRQRGLARKGGSVLKGRPLRGWALAWRQPAATSSATDRQDAMMGWTGDRMPPRIAAQAVVRVARVGVRMAGWAGTDRGEVMVV